MTLTKSAPPIRKERQAERVQLEAKYQEKAKAMLRDAIGTEYATLSEKLNDAGIDITARGLENKIARGTFSAAFMLQCLDLLADSMLDSGEES
ncbi:DUF6471 domain-containing protein [Ponticaulis koreensis]|uniref:DUF6471 domain-containing protein n=1 Tax=Ponticaulis koreensis TaxID=1123045 RepID=UPI0003B7B7B6|nr:DUF6471 domain-containing protein [Ponticaulis koreensis]